jgi:hypothetical protein
MVGLVGLDGGEFGGGFGGGFGVVVDFGGGVGSDLGGGGGDGELWREVSEGMGVSIVFG